MDTKEALELSIRHWEENVISAAKGETLLLGSGQCALCSLFLPNECLGCPIRKKTGRINCKNTPYDNVVDIKQDYLIPIEELKAKLVDACKQELEFLKSLRESEE